MSHPLLDHFASQASRRATPHKTQIRVQAGESRVLPRSTRRVRVLSGKAWLSHETADQIVRYHESIQLQHSQSGTVVTALGQEHLELEILA